MTEGPYRVEEYETDVWYAGQVVDKSTHWKLTGPTPGVGSVITMSEAELQKEADALNSAFAAGAESNARYKAAWEDANGLLLLLGITIPELDLIARRRGLGE